MEAELVKREGLSYTEIPAAGVHGVGLRRLPGNLAALFHGYRRARQALARFRPDVLFFTGGYVAVPMALARRGQPALVYTPDIEPGLALKFLARSADVIAVSDEESRRYYSPRARVVVTGYPVRPDLLRWTRPEAQQALGLEPGLPTLLVFGGSKGARSLNRATLAALPELLPHIQVVHLTGSLDWPEVETARRGLPASAPAARYHAHPYLHAEMGAAFAAADLAVCRAGASTLGELPAFGLPAVLVPYPYAWRYQRVNADHLAGRGAAVTLEDRDLPERLLPTVLGLIDDPARLEAMRSAMRALARPQAAGEIANLLVELAGAARPKGRKP
jgi:UDP-N-acetylglucosamine--N-acetylmuramyl-(pentapeptide) pyrophosphoryl-undecaprenol N-acetylglucosamine transferase